MNLWIYIVSKKLTELLKKKMKKWNLRLKWTLLHFHYIKVVSLYFTSPSFGCIEKHPWSPDREVGPWPKSMKVWNSGLVVLYGDILASLSLNMSEVRGVYTDESVRRGFMWRLWKSSNPNNHSNPLIMDCAKSDVPISVTMVTIIMVPARLGLGKDHDLGYNKDFLVVMTTIDHVRITETLLPCVIFLYFVDPSRPPQPSPIVPCMTSHTTPSPLLQS